jgi:hypothetical protein
VKTPSRVPGLLPAIGAFVLTVLLGVGGTAASALWQQSATATMTVTADGSWPGQLTCSRVDSADKFVDLAYAFPGAPTALALSVKKVDGTYSTGTAVTPLSATGTLQLRGDSSLLTPSAGLSPVSVRLTASFANQTQVLTETTVRLDLGTNSGKIYCS